MAESSSSESREARVPDIGDFDKVPVIEVLVAEGDRVEKDQGLVTLESDKATMEVPAPFAGTVRAVKVAVGDEVGEGTVVALIDGAGEDDEAQAAGKPDGGDEADDKDSGRDQDRSPPSGTDEKRDESKEKDKAKEKDKPTEKAGGAGQGRDADGSHATRSDRADAGERRSPPVAFDADQVLPDKVPYASPSVRQFARELGVDLGRVSGSGRGGRITRDDVQGFVKGVMQGGGSAASSSGAGLSLLPWPKVDFSKYGEVETRELSRIQKISGANLARNWAMIPHVTQHDEADITEMEAFRKRLGEENKDLKLTPLVFLIKAAVAALKAFPDFNASLEPDAATLVLKKYFHVGIAVDTPDGLVVPVLRDCDRKGLLQLAAELGEISKKARDRKLGPADMSGGCFSISSLGGIGGSAFTPIVNAPEVAILGVSRSAMKPVWDGSAFQPRLMLPLSLSYDHRVIDGAAAARFTAHLAKTLGDVRRLLL